MKKQRKITDKEQRVAVDILNNLCFCEDIKEMFRIFDDIVKEYNLFKDPFTCMYCTPKEYEEYSLEYEKQLMIQKYGHCDGLE